MSYILEALKKSEQERQLGAVPRPEAAVAATRVASRSRWPWLLSAVLLLNAGILLLLVLRPAAPPVASAPVPAAGSLAGAGQDAEQMPPPADPPEKSVAQPPQSPVAAQPQPRPEPTPEPVPEPVSEPAPAAVATAPAPGSVQWMQRPEGAESPAPAAPRAPHWDELGASEKNGLNRPRLDVHVYAEASAQRFVLIDLKRYREGERLDNGGRLVAITPEGVIIEARGIRYRIGRP